jgi:hypothetical protein
MVFCGLFILSNCKDDCDRVIRTNLVDLDKYVPYTGNDTLRFLRNSTDTQIFVGQGLERFYVSGGKNSNADCPEDHESVRIRFLNIKNAKEITLIYKYDLSDGVNEFEFYYQNENFNNYIIEATNKSKITVNGVDYLYVAYHSSSSDTSRYLAFCYPPQNGNIGIVKVKYPQDTLTLIR